MPQNMRIPVIKIIKRHTDPAITVTIGPGFLTDEQSAVIKLKTPDILL
jgi:hypothetical protein